jgi:hypothetical protein
MPAVSIQKMLLTVGAVAIIGVAVAILYVFIAEGP